MYLYLSGEGEGEAPEVDVVVVSPPLQRVKAISEASEASDPSSVNSQGWEDTGEGWWDACQAGWQHRTSCHWVEERVAYRE